MRKVFIIVFFVFSIFLLSSSNVEAQRAECDACGYCFGRTEPSNWESCRACLYPNASKNPKSNETLLLERTASGRMEPVKKAEGKYYTQLGCLDIGKGSFSDPTAAGGVLNFLLTRLIFPIVGTVSFISLVYGAFLLITAQDAPEQVSKGKSYIVGAIVGLIFTFSAVLLINILAGDILKIPGFSRSGALQITLRGSSTTSPEGIETAPHVEIYIDKEKINEYDIQGTQTISETVANNLPGTTQISIVFTNDFCPDCEAKKNPTYANSPNRHYGDRNLFISGLTLNGKSCKAITYTEKLSGKQTNITLPADIYWTGTATCTSF